MTIWLIASVWLMTVLNDTFGNRATKSVLLDFDVSSTRQSQRITTNYSHGSGQEGLVSNPASPECKAGRQKKKKKDWEGKKKKKKKRKKGKKVTSLSQTLLLNIFQSSGSGRKLVLSTSRSCIYAVSFIYTFTAALKLVLILLVSKRWPSKLCPWSEYLPRKWSSYACHIVIISMNFTNSTPSHSFYISFISVWVLLWFVQCPFGYIAHCRKACILTEGFSVLFLSCKANGSV